MNFRFALLSLFFSIFAPELYAKAKIDFTVNTIAYAPSAYQKGPAVELYEDDVAELPYFVDHGKGHKRGKIILSSEQPKPNDKPEYTSNSLHKFFKKIRNESFGTVKKESQDLADEHLNIAVLLNRIHSVDMKFNRSFFVMQDDLETPLDHSIILAMWEPVWKKKIIRPGQPDRVEFADFGEVVKFYKQLKKDRPEVANAFLYYNEHKNLKPLVPYRELRECLLKSASTKDMVKKHQENHLESHVYLAFLDHDTKSFRTGEKGVFSCYQKLIKQNKDDLPLCITGGYSISKAQHPDASFASALDLGVRRALASVLPLAPYYPEPNTAILVYEGENTLDGTFLLSGQSWRDRHTYVTPNEMPNLISSVIAERYSDYSEAAALCHFIEVGDIETEAPPRFFENRRDSFGVKNKKKHAYVYDANKEYFSTYTLQDLINVRNTSQSHLKSNDWAKSVRRYLCAAIGEVEGGVKIVNSKAPAATIKKRKDQLIVSLFASLHAGYSPIAITIAALNKKSTDCRDYLYNVIKNYDTRVPADLVITYGARNTPSTKPTGDLLRKKVKNYQQMITVVDKLYKAVVGEKVRNAAMLCGKAEIAPILNFLIYRHVPKTIKIKKEREKG